MVGGVGAGLASCFGYFFFQAEDGIRDYKVTGVQTCALPILPGLSGYEVGRRLRAEPALGETLLVAVTGHGREEDRRSSREAGFDLHLTKPVDPDRKSVV